MLAIKDGISEKLSRLFSDSPSSQTLDQECEAGPCAKDGKSVSSTLSFILPSFGWFRTNGHKNEVKSMESSNSFKWKSKSFSWKDKPLDAYSECDPVTVHENRESKNLNDENNKLSGSPSEYREPGSGRSTSSSSDIFEAAVSPHGFESSMSTLMDDSLFISPHLHQFFDSSLPNIVKGCQWVLLYSTVRHGISLRTLIRNTSGHSGPCLLITGDKQGAVFGGLLDCPLTATAKRKYQGTTQTFVFTTVHGEPTLFRPTGANRYFYLCLNDLLALGGGANFALCLNEDLLSGTTGSCETFGNSCLAHEQEFEVKNVEVMILFLMILARVLPVYVLHIMIWVLIYRLLTSHRHTQFLLKVWSTRLLFSFQEGHRLVAKCKIVQLLSGSAFTEWSQKRDLSCIILSHFLGWVFQKAIGN